MCNHVLRLYVSAEKPTEELIKLVTFLVRVYIPTWFDIVLNPSILQSPKILQRIAASLDELDQQEFFTKEEKEDMVDTYNHSAYACHHEMVLVAMLVDDDLAKRELACKTIKEIREKKEAQPAKRGPKPIRDFQPPKVCSTEKGWSHIKDYTDFIPSFKDTANMTEPPITMDFDDDELEAIVRDPVNNFPKLYWDMPNHTTCVERKIKLVTFISRNYEVGHSSGRFEQEMSSAIFSQLLMPQFETKEDYVSHHIAANEEEEQEEEDVI